MEGKRMDKIIKKEIKVLQKDLKKVNKYFDRSFSSEVQIALDNLSWLLVDTINELEEASSEHI